MKKGWLFFAGVGLLTLAFRQDSPLGSAGVARLEAGDFNPGLFQAPPRSFGPFTRWWLPGNDVSSDELRREIRMLADKGFAGVEIQPLAMGLNPAAPKDRLERVNSWDTPSFYEHLRAILEQARQSGVVVDMNGGSGWPLGGAFFDPRESMRTLAVGDTSLAAGQIFDSELPRPLAGAKPQGMMAMMLQKNPVEWEWSRVVSVTAARVTGKPKGQTALDPASVVDLTARVSNGRLRWQAPADGQWRIIVAWSVPTGEKPSLIASSKTNYVVDHLDPAIVRKTYDYLLGPRTGLTPFFGNPLRAVFNDSYEFHTDRLISPDFRKVFRDVNGYDVGPYLGAVFQKGYNHPTYLANLFPGAKPPFSFGEQENRRLMYDYDAAVNRVFQQHFIKTSNEWLGQRGMRHRTQAYGFPIDVIGGAGAADIPEAEQLFAEGSEGYLKLVTSGAHLYGRPVVTQESFVSIYRAEMTTPQKIKAWADKSFACGINQLIYHGTPYRYNPGDFGPEGWNTWSSPYMPFVNFSTGMNESDPFWNDIGTVNQYLTRCQYALRTGKPHTDVLVYMPFNNFTEDQLASNPAEILKRGFFEGIEPKVEGGMGLFKSAGTPITAWYEALWPIVNELEARGVSWEFVNDDALRSAALSGGRLTIGGNTYQALILSHLPFVPLPTAQKLRDLSRSGLNIWTAGALPTQQPSFLNYEANDRLAAGLMTELSQQPSTRAWSPTLTEGLLRPVRPGRPMDFTRHLTRQMSDGSRLLFFWNKTDQPQTLALTVDGSLPQRYWLNPEEGRMHKADGQTLQYELPPYGSVLLYASKKAVPASRLSAPPLGRMDELARPANWTIRVGEVSLDNHPLLDWRTHDRLRFQSAEGVYASTFTLPAVDPATQYWVDLGNVFHTAAVSVNGKPAGKRLFAPYRLNISSLVRSGENRIDVRVTPTRRNGFVGEAAKGNARYAQFKGQENTLLPSGLAGPVRILAVRRTNQ